MNPVLSFHDGSESTSRRQGRRCEVVTGEEKNLPLPDSALHYYGFILYE